jgi:hypothetical protein
MALQARQPCGQSNLCQAQRAPALSKASRVSPRRSRRWRERVDDGQLGARASTFSS